MKYISFLSVLSSVAGFSVSPLSRGASTTSLNMNKAELKETADYIARPGFGLLACDESTKTVGARLESIGMGKFCMLFLTDHRCDKITNKKSVLNNRRKHGGEPQDLARDVVFYPQVGKLCFWSNSLRRDFVPGSP